MLRHTDATPYWETMTSSGLYPRDGAGTWTPPMIMATILAIRGGYLMRFASVAEVKDGLSRYLARARKNREPIVVTHHGKPYALIQPLDEEDLEELEWKQLARRKLAKAWEGEDDALY